MPNFNTHWIVAIETINNHAVALSPAIRKGFDVYKEIMGDTAEKLRRKLGNLMSEPYRGKAATKSIKERLNKAENKLRSSKHLHNVTCFSAYMLGACGPDFWTLPTDVGDVLPSFASLHFDLGHYNRTHQQFAAAVKRWSDSGHAPGDHQYQVEQSYYFGMATHIAADLIIHQLVNVYAGAYNTLDHVFADEQATIPEQDLRNIVDAASGYLITPIRWAMAPKVLKESMVRKYADTDVGMPIANWTTHNKVEHYWDSYVRYRYLSDYGAVFGEEDDESLTRPLGVPVVQTLLRDLRLRLERLGKQTTSLAEQMSRMRDRSPTNVAYLEVKYKRDAILRKIRPIRALYGELQSRDLCFEIDKFTNFPRIFCDRVKAGEVKPFIYDIFVAKGENASYPDTSVFKGVIAEATSPQMTQDSAKPSEISKLNFFATESNKLLSFYNNNYLTHHVCPDLRRLAKYGKDVFYDFKSLGKFVPSATAIAGRFARDLGAAVKQGESQRGIPLESINLGRELGGFWNLDTGLGVRVEPERSSTSKEVITTIKLHHVGRLPLGIASFDKTPGRMQCGPNHYLDKKPFIDTPPLFAEPAFPTKINQRFAKLEEVHDAASYYLDRINIAGGQGHRTSHWKIDNFFKDVPNTFVKRIMARSGLVGGNNRVVATDVKHRLSLQIEASMLPLDETEHHFYLHGDEEIGLNDAYTFRNGVPVTGAFGKNTVKWYETNKEKLLDTIHARRGSGKDRGYEYYGKFVNFSTAVLINLEKDDDLERKTEQGRWNNVIEYKKHKKHYGRNFAVSLARPDVLKPIDKGKFLKDTSYSRYRYPMPTEQIFFSLYVLVRNGDECYDAIAKKYVKEKDLEDIVKIDCVGFVKIVLFYVITANGAAQLDECYIDGLKVPVK